MLKVGAVSYINTLPLLHGMRSGVTACSSEMTYGVPADLNKELRSGALDMSIVSAAEYLAHRDLYDLVPGYCIASVDKVLSVNLYTRSPLSELSGKECGLTQESASSVLLTRTLCHHYWKQEPTFVPLREEFTNHDAFVLIGDAALDNLTVPGYQTIDLAQAWYYATGLPFTFAVIASRKGTDPEAISIFLDELGQSLTWGENNMPEIYRLAAQRCPIGGALLEEYYHSLNFRFGPAQLQAVELFDTLSQEVSVTL